MNFSLAKISLCYFITSMHKDTQHENEEDVMCKKLWISVLVYFSHYAVKTGV